MMTMLPQFLLSGLFFPLYSMPWGVRWIGYLLPLTWFIKVARGVMVRGAPIGALWLPLVVLAVMAVVVFTASTLRFRRDLAPAGGPRRTDPADRPEPARETTDTAAAGTRRERARRHSPRPRRSRLGRPRTSPCATAAGRRSTA